MNRLATLTMPDTRPAYASLPQILRGASIHALYLHVPFCSTKCHYCDFYSLAGHTDRVPAYLEALAREITIHQYFFGTLRPETIFIGGGTPTLLEAPDLHRLLTLIRNAIDPSALTEWTIEANPNTFDDARAQVAAAAGINRISFGAQSFHAAELRMLQRDHDPESAPEAFATARRAGIHNLNLDLIFGIPGQTQSSWAESLRRALALEPSHISCYSLTYEPTTAMTARLARKEFDKIDEDLELRLFEQVYRTLSSAGFTRYETSNYARVKKSGIPQTCHHNLAYWKAKNWLGLGPSAGSHIALPDRAGPVAWQWKNAGSLAHYLEALGNHAAAPAPITEMEVLSRENWAAAAAIFWLRLDEGLAFEEFFQRTGVRVEEDLQSVLGPFAREGLVEFSADRVRISEKGVAVSNHMLSRVLTRLQKP